MMKTIAATELKARLSEFLGDVERGEVINVTRHGKTIARLAPPDGEAEQRRRDKAFDDLIAWRKSLPKMDSPLTVEEILSARDEGRK